MINTTSKNIWLLEVSVLTSYRSMVTAMRPPPEAIMASDPIFLRAARSFSRISMYLGAEPGGTSRPSKRMCTRILLAPRSTHPFINNCKSQAQPESLNWTSSQAPRNTSGVYFGFYKVRTNGVSGVIHGKHEKNYVPTVDPIENAHHHHSTGP